MVFFKVEQPFQLSCYGLFDFSEKKEMLRSMLRFYVTF